jgi:hypothetical protein
MKCKTLIALITVALFNSQTARADWFEQSNPLTKAHQQLLMGDLTGMYDSLVRVWQSPEAEQLSEHLNRLLIQSLDMDCGKTLSSSPLPQWLSNITVRSIELQSPGRDAHQLVIESNSQQALKSVTMEKWPNKLVSQDSSLTLLQSDGVTSAYLKRYNLNAQLEQGLYHLTITGADNTTWNQWVVLAMPSDQHTVHWAAKDEWRVKKTAIPNVYCPLPKMVVSLYRYRDGKYTEVLRKGYDSDYPQSLPNYNLEPNRYILAIAMNHQRWQGPLIIEQSQVISKTYDVTAEE